MRDEDGKWLWENERPRDREKVGRIVIYYYAICFFVIPPPAMDSSFLLFLIMIYIQKIYFLSFLFSNILLISISLGARSVFSFSFYDSYGIIYIMYLRIERYTFGIKANSGTEK